MFAANPKSKLFDDPVEVRGRVLIALALAGQGKVGGGSQRIGVPGAEQVGHPVGRPVVQEA
jgi:hypothetical protein